MKRKINVFNAKSLDAANVKQKNSVINAMKTRDFCQIRKLNQLYNVYVSSIITKIRIILNVLSVPQSLRVVPIAKVVKIVRNAILKLILF
jgi:hypothetical protein